MFKEKEKEMYEFGKFWKERLGMHAWNEKFSRLGLSNVFWMNLYFYIFEIYHRLIILTLNIIILYIVLLYLYK